MLSCVSIFSSKYKDYLCQEVDLSLKCSEYNEGYYSSSVCISAEDACVENNNTCISPFHSEYSCEDKLSLLGCILYTNSF